MRLEITISGNTVPLYYGLLHAEMLEVGVVKGDIQGFTADFIPLFFHAAYVNYCKINDIAATLPKGAFYKWYEELEDKTTLDPYFTAWESTKSKESWDKVIGNLSRLTDEQKKSTGVTQNDTALA